MQASTVVLAPAKPTVLLVEDEILIRMMIAEELREHGMDVLEASRAEEAVILLESALPVDLVFTDVHLPGAMNGLALAEHVRARYPRLKLIVTSSQRPAQIADHFIPKPYDLRAVIRQVEALLAPFSDDD
jgi:two-component system, response regulator PdtaR